MSNEPRVIMQPWIGQDIRIRIQQAHDIANAIKADIKLPAGGFFRDCRIWQFPKDLDIFTYGVDENHLRTLPEAFERSTDPYPATHSPINTVFTGWSYALGMPVQIIDMAQPFNWLQFIKQFDFAFCQIYHAVGQETPVGTEGFLQDLYAKTMTITLPGTSRPQRIVSTQQRAKRFVERFPDWRLVDPNNIMNRRILLNDDYRLSPGSLQYPDDDIPF